MGRMRGTIWCIYVHSQNRYMHPVESHTITRDSRTASPREIFFVSFAKTVGASTDAMIPRIANTIVPVMIPGAANPYDSIAIKRCTIEITDKGLN